MDLAINIDPTNMSISVTHGRFDLSKCAPFFCDEKRHSLINIPFWFVNYEAILSYPSPVRHVEGSEKPIKTWGPSVKTGSMGKGTFLAIVNGFYIR